MAQNLTRKYSINFSIPKRDKKIIKFIIIHYTGMAKESLAIKRLTDPKAKVSAHYLIKNNGQIINLVPDLYEAWHAGKSSWKNLESLNRYSIGIEITNPGHEFGYKNFSDKQILSLKRLLKHLMKTYRIKKNNILGHSDIAPMRKQDPGEKFPWERLAKSGLCQWHNLNKSQLKKFRGIKLSNKYENELIKNLNKIGYFKIKKNISKKNKKLNLIAFQRKYRQDLIDGKSDKECYLLSKSLLD
tara:strand:- start:123 stop:851 length:729 start_codon:yes stop_codon:yes gene_type:complete